MADCLDKTTIGLRGLQIMAGCELVGGGFGLGFLTGLVIFCFVDIPKFCFVS